jgi:heme exporter protein A
MIAVEGLSVSFGRTLALDNISLELEPGIHGLFGPNGSGKSTLLRVIAGLLRPSTGAVAIDGRQTTSEETRRLIGYAGHAPGLYRDLTIKENFDLFARLYGAAETRSNEVLGALGLSRLASVRAGELSSGFARRAGVGRALVHDPTVLLLDEPYANVDDEAAEMISSALQLWRQPNRTAVVATHGAKKLKAYADAGVILRDGRVVTAGRYRREVGVR